MTEQHDSREGSIRYTLAQRLIAETIETIGPATFDVLGEGSEARLTDAFYNVLEEATGPGPYTLEVATVLNDTHVTARTLGLDYGVETEDGAMVVYLASEDQAVETVIPTDDVEEDTLFSALKHNLATFKVKSPA